MAYLPHIGSEKNHHLDDRHEVEEAIIFGDPVMLLDGVCLLLHGGLQNWPTHDIEEVCDKD